MAIEDRRPAKKLRRSLLRLLRANSESLYDGAFLLIGDKARIEKITGYVKKPESAASGELRSLVRAHMDIPVIADSRYRSVLMRMLYLDGRVDGALAADMSGRIFDCKRYVYVSSGDGTQHVTGGGKNIAAAYAALAGITSVLRSAETGVVRLYKGGRTMTYE